MAIAITLDNNALLASQWTQSDLESGTNEIAHRHAHLPVLVVMMSKTYYPAEAC